jgi:hypothetical protein
MPQLMLHPNTLVGTSHHCCGWLQLMLPPHLKGDWHRYLDHCHYVIITPPTQWTEFVQHSNHHAVLSLATTSPDLLIPTSRHSSLPTVPRFAPFSSVLQHMLYVQFQGPRVQFIIIEDVGLLSISCHRTSQFTIMLDIPV